jgi:uncharacterized protein YecT (DUF1311 family)
MTRPLFFLLLAALVLTTAGGSAQNCDRPSSVPEMTECATLRLRAAEREMGEFYGRLLDSEDRDFAAAAREAQEAWMKWREAEGRLAAKTVGDPGLAAHARKNQEAIMTEDRVRDLRGYAGN